MAQILRSTRRRVSTSVVLMVMGLLFGASGAEAQCIISAVSSDQTGGSYYPRMIAQTQEYGQGCDPTNTQTEAWISGQTEARVICIYGQQNGIVCKSTGTGTTYTDVEGMGCGRWTGVSKHWAILNGAYTAIGPSPRTTSLVAGLCKAIAAPEYCSEWEMWDEQTQQCVPYNTPVLIPLTRAQSITLTNIEGGVSFDHRGDGAVERTAWTAGDSRVAFLAIDRNGNGTIDNGTELLGNHTIPGAANGFDALDKLNQEMGGSRDTGVIDATQPVFIKLLLWEDSNHNGLSEPAELQSASNIVSAIGLGLQVHNRRDRHNNRFYFRGWAHVRTAPGQNAPRSGAEDRERTIDIYDVIFTNR